MDLQRRTGRVRAASLALVASLLIALPATSSQARQAQDSTSTTTPGSTTTTPGVGAIEPEGDNPQIGKEYNDVLRELVKLQTQLDKTQSEARIAQLKLVQLRKQTRDTQISLLKAQDTYKKAKQQLALREISREKAEKRVDRAVDRLRRQAVASFVRGGDRSVMEAFFSARNGEEAGQALAYGSAALGSTDSLVQSLAKARAQQRKAARAARRSEKLASDTRTRIENAKNFLVAARDRQAKLVEQVDLKVFAVNAALLDVQTKALLTEGKVAGAKADGIGGMLAAIQAGEPDFTMGSVDISVPLPGKQPSSPFGIRYHPILHIYRLHAGCDIGAPSGTEIHAPADGVVVIAGQHGGYGNYTAIDHGNSLATGFGHQSEILVKVGQVVKKGDIIGKVGNTGLSTGPHLHFETRIKGVPVNPEGIIDFDALPTYPVAKPPGN